MTTAVANYSRLGRDLLTRTWPGILLAAGLAIVAGWIASGLGDPWSRNPVLVAMLFGLLVGNTFKCPEQFLPGFDFTKRYLLRLAVALVGLRVTVGLLLELGLAPLTIAAIELVTVFIALRWIAVRWFKLDADLALLIAAGTAICGAAAILAVAALMKIRDQLAGLSVALITLAGTVALLAYPEAFLAGWLPGLDDQLYGIFVGASIYELAQVYGAAIAVSEGALNAATLVKLSKVVMLIPLLLVLDALRRLEAPHLSALAGKLRLWPARSVGQMSAQAESRRLSSPPPAVQVPWFIVSFVVLMLLNSVITLNPVFRRFVLDINQLLFLMVMVALGITTRLSRLGEVGGAWRIVGLGAISLALTAGLTFVLVQPLASRTAGPTLSLQGQILSTAGGRLFVSTGCAKCHVPVLRGRKGPVVLYSDLLLHNMGPALDDKIVQGSAMGSEWRTTPLVGIAKRKRFLHDGRATTIRDAIHAHGGTAETVQNRFFGLSAAEQKIMIEFVSGL